MHTNVANLTSLCVTRSLYDKSTVSIVVDMWMVKLLEVLMTSPCAAIYWCLLDARDDYATF